MNRVLVTGASGFVGHHLCRYLAHKKYKVLGTYRAKRPGSLKSVCDLRCLDITDALAVAGLMQSYRPQYTVHLAAQSSPRMSWQTENETMDINVRGTINLLRAMREHASGSRFLFTSTNLVYGRSFRDGKSCSEQSPLSPESPYAISKVLAELACRDFHTKYGLDIIVARPFNHFGPGQKPPFVFADWCRQIAEAEGGRRKRVLEVGNLDAYRDLIPVQDVVEAYEVLLRKGRGGETYNVCTGKARLLKDYVRYLVRHAKVKLSVKVRRGRLRRGDPKRILGSPAKMRSLGWKSQGRVAEALVDTVASWRRSPRG